MKTGLDEQAKEMRERITFNSSYDKALCIIGEYVNIISTQDEQERDCDLK